MKMKHQNAHSTKKVITFYLTQFLTEMYDYKMHTRRHARAITHIHSLS